MNSYLRQSTASQSRAIGPFVSSSDFITPQTGLTIANTDIKLVINGAASVNKNSGGGTHRVNGVYGITFDATDTATVGELEVSIFVSGACVAFHTFVVLEEAAYDAIYATNAPGYAVGLIQAIWDALTSALTTAGSIGKLLVDNINATISSRLASSAITLSGGAVTVGTNNDKTGYAIGTGGISASSFAAGAIDASAIAANAIGSSEFAQSACDKNADSLLARNINGGSSTGRIVKEALKGMRNRVDGSSGTLTVYEEDDSTPAWTAALTRSAVDPITEIDPS